MYHRYPRLLQRLTVELLKKMDDSIKPAILQQVRCAHGETHPISKRVGAVKNRPRTRRASVPKVLLSTMSAGSFFWAPDATGLEANLPPRGLHREGAVTPRALDLRAYAVSLLQGLARGGMKTPTLTCMSLLPSRLEQVMALYKKWTIEFMELCAAMDD
jgi:hypothetical protein